MPVHTHGSNEVENSTTVDVLDANCINAAIIAYSLK
jgi:hypothetical protein